MKIVQQNIKPIFLLTVIFLLTTLTSCDCLQMAAGKVYDADTKQPLDSAYAHKDTKDYGDYTDSDGKFDLEAISGGFCGCPPMTVVISKDGYEEKIVEIKGESQEDIYLIRKK